MRIYLKGVRAREKLGWAAEVRLKSKVSRHQTQLDLGNCHRPEIDARKVFVCSLRGWSDQLCNLTVTTYLVCRKNVLLR